MSCPNCGSTDEESETIVDPAATHRETTVTTCADCGDVLDAIQH